MKNSTHQSLVDRDLEKVLSQIPDVILDLLKEENVFLAGGALLSAMKEIEINDFDLFGTSKDELQRVYRDMHNKHVSRLVETKNAATLVIKDTKPVQFITRWVFANAVDCMMSFDFTVCRIAIWYENGAFRSAVDSRFYDDLYTNRLTYTSPDRDEDSAGSLLRAFKYAKKGYNVPKETIMAVVARFVAGLDADQENRLDEMDESELYDTFFGAVSSQFSYVRGNY